MKKPLLFFGILILIGAFIFFNRNQTNKKLNKETNNSVTKNSPNSKQGKDINTKSQDRTLASTQNPNESFTKKEKELLDYLQSTGTGEWEFIRDSNGKIMSVSGGTVPSVGKDQDSALDFARKLASYFQVDSTQIFAHKDNTSLSETALSKVYRFEQKVNNYTVYGSGMTLMASKTDDAAYMITTDLKEVKGLNFKAAETTSSEDFKSTLLKEFPSQQKTEIKYIEPEPVIWANSDPAELAWVFVVENWNPKLQKLRVLVGTESGKILFKEKVSFN
jgi:hypothetical protein